MFSWSTTCRRVIYLIALSIKELKDFVDAHKTLKIFVTGPAKINHMSINYTELYFC